MSAVLDASAILAYLQDEPGAERVRIALDGGRLSAVNWSEVSQKIQKRGGDPVKALADLRTLGLLIEPFTEAQADHAAQLYPHAQPLGLGIADRACIALGVDRSAPVLTADQIWTRLKLDIPIQPIR